MAECRILQLLYLLVLITSSLQFAVQQPPIGKIVLLGDSAEFECLVEGHSPHWVIDGTRYNRNVHGSRGIERTLLQQISSQEFLSRLQVNATESNNNTELLCRIANTGVESQPVFLIVQGLLDPPSNITVSVTNVTVAHITWSAPYSLDLTGESDILGYNFTIQDTLQHTILSLNVNSSITEYYFTNNYCPLDTYSVLVAGINRLGVGSSSSPVLFVHGFIVVDLNLTSSSQFTCEALCDDSLLVTWLINGSFLSQLGSQLSVRLESNYSFQCASRDTGSTHTTTLEVVSDIPTPYTVQCVAVSTCGQTDETTNCRTETCYSQYYSVLMEGNDKQVPPLTTTMDSTTLLDTTSKVPPIANDSVPLVTVGSAAGILVILCCFLLIVLGVTCCHKVTKATATEVSAKNNEVIYEQFGGPIYSVVGMQAHPAPPSPPPITKPCEAYAASSQPTTEPNTAYATTPH